MHVPEWVYMWYDDKECCDDNDEDNFFKWYQEYQNERLKKLQGKKSSYPSPGTHHVGGIGAFLNMRKKRQKNCF